MSLHVWSATKKISLFWEHATFHNLCLLQGLFKKMIYFFLLSNEQTYTYPKSKMKDDNSRQFDQVKCRSGNVKNANVWMNQNYNASQEVSNILLTLGGPIIYELFWSLGNARLTAIIYACIWTWHITIVYTAWSNKFWTTEV